MKKKIFIMTARFPYLPGEQFLEPEIARWGQYTDTHEVILVPGVADGEPRNVPENITVNVSFARARKSPPGMYHTLRALVSPLFLKEVVSMTANRKLHFSTFFTALQSTALVLQAYAILKTILPDKDSRVIVYAYWLDTVAYAACLLKHKKLVNRVVARAHGYDVYEERHPYHYMPLKRQFVHLFDAVLAVSGQGKAYLQRTHGFPGNSVVVDRLGVSVAGATSLSPGQNSLAVVSVSSCSPVKRIDKILGALAALAKEAPHLNISWVHIGDGPLRGELEEMARYVLSASNVSYAFLGQLAHADVRRYIAGHPISALVNISESEGVPVSIMEAMSAGIPAIAPDVGGISELVSNETGRLLSSRPETSEIVSALKDVRHLNSGATRRLARAKILSDYNAEINFPKAIRDILGYYDS